MVRENGEDRPSHVHVEAGKSIITAANHRLAEGDFHPVTIPTQPSRVGESYQVGIKFPPRRGREAQPQAIVVSKGRRLILVADMEVERHRVLTLPGQPAFPVSVGDQDKGLLVSIITLKGSRGSNPESQETLHLARDPNLWTEDSPLAHILMTKTVKELMDIAEMIRSGEKASIDDFYTAQTKIEARRARDRFEP